jgi:hypothetical protein
MTNEEVIARRAARKRPKARKIYGTFFPYPISGCGVPDDSGVVFRTIFPVAGDLIRVVVHADVQSPDNPVKLEAVLEAGEDTYSRMVTIRKIPTAADLDLPVPLGGRLTVSVVSGNVQTPVWVGLLFIPATSDARVRKILMEE